MRPRIQLFDIINTLIMILVVLVTFYPFYYIIIYSISDSQEALKGVYLWPRGFELSAFVQVASLDNLLHSGWISALRTVTGTLLTVVCCSFLSYLVTQKDMLFRRAVYRFVVASLYFSPGLIAVYLTYASLGLRNNFLVYILPSAVVGFYVVLIKTYIESLPAALEESAKIDGAGYLTIFFRIVFPLSAPILATVAVYSAVGQWNSFSDTLFYMSDKNLYTAQYVLYNYLSQAEMFADQLRLNANGAVPGGIKSAISPMKLQMTITLLVTLPVLFIYPFLQRFFVKGLLLGAVKG